MVHPNYDFSCTWQKSKTNNQLWRWPGAWDTKISSIRKYIVGDMRETMWAKMIISRDPGRFPKWEFDTNASQHVSGASYTWRVSKIIKINSFQGVEGSRASPGEAHTSPIVPLKNPIHRDPYRSTWKPVGILYDCRTGCNSVLLYSVPSAIVY